MDEDLYKTTSFKIAAWFITNDIQCIGVEWGTKTAKFVFPNFEGREQLERDFYQDRLLLKYITAEKELKAMMYADKEPEKY